MSGTKTGGQKAAKTNLKFTPDYYKIIGAKGGKVKTKKGFATVDQETLKEWGSRGGKNRWKNR